ncbi:hypothetical protein [uncultured Brevibacillus sp.]|uniref:phage neck terminator protein n=1 Tax=uncultured Brevibacillus sp. TaxID=169970 RepID=UPI002593FAA9|nr:hypothetical protein [uncultured Brevibacillus sp.]
MSDIALSLTAIEDIFQACTLKILGLDPEAEENQNRIRIGYPADGAPAWQRTDNVGFIIVSPANDPYAQQVERSYSQTSETTADNISSYTRVHQVQWTFYGPSSFDDADRVRAGLFRSPLLFSPMHLVTDVPTPVRLPELFGGQWWERTSFTAKFNEKVVRSSTVHYIEAAEIKVVPDR